MSSTKTQLASLGVLVLTVLHHLYAATIYDAPFRQHVAFGILPVLLVLILTVLKTALPELSLGSQAPWC